MHTTIVRYKVKPDRAEENKRYIRAVFDELHHTKPAGLRYVAFNLGDTTSFLHVAVVEEEGANPLTETPAFQRFVAEIADRCEEPPVATDAEIVGSYRLFWERALSE